MAKSVRMEVIDHGAHDRDGLLRITFLNQDLAGKRASFTLEAEVKVDDSSPVHDDKVLHKEEFTISAHKPMRDIRLPSASFDHFSYQGNKIDILLHCKLTIDDSILFDTKLTEALNIPLGDKPKINNNASAIIDPKDIFNFFANLKAIPAHNQLLTLGLAVIGGIVIVVNAIIGIHDQFVPQSMTWLYSHPTNSDDSGPLESALAGSGILGVMINEFRM